MDERRTDPREDRLVLRVEISAEEGSALGADALAAGLQRLVVPAPAPAPAIAPAPAPDGSAERAELVRRAAELAERESELLLYVGEVQGELSRREVGWWPTGAAPGTVRHH